MTSMASISESEDLYKIALMIDQLKHDDLQLRVSASMNIVSISRALGAERTRNELVPFLTDTIDDEDEVLLIVAEKLGELSEYVGGLQYYKDLLVPLEHLVCGEEDSVRLMAIKSTESIVGKMNDADVGKYFLPMLNKLVAKDWFTARGSAAALTHLSRGISDEKMRRDMKLLFLKLCADDTPFVRRAAAQHITNMIKSFAADGLNDYIDAFKNFSRDDQDSIRMQVVAISIALLEHTSPDAMANHIVPVLLQISNDRSWRVRWSLANQLHVVLQLMESSNSAGSLSGVFDGLLNDTEPEVRAAAASHLSQVCKFIPRSIVMNKIMSTAQRMVNDTSEFVRAFFATEINYLSPLLGRDATVQYILPMLLLLLRDDTSEVRLNVISSLEAINKIIGIELLSQSLLPAIVDLAQDHKWRVRLAIIEHIPMLGKQLGVDFFNDKLNTLCMGWLNDDVYSIRKAAAENLRRLTQLFGTDWCKENIIPKIQKMQCSTSFSQRLTALYAVQVLIMIVSNNIVESSIMPLLTAMSTDTVPNIRFTVAKTLQIAAPILRDGKALVTSTSSILSRLSSDSDRDVRFYAEKAIEQMHMDS